MTQKRNNQNKIKIASFNLFNLHKANVKYYDHYKYSTEDYNKKKWWIANQIDKMGEALPDGIQTYDYGPNIIGYQELWSNDALKECLEMSQTANDHQCIFGDRLPNRPGVALSTNYPVLEKSSYKKLNVSLAWKDIDIKSDSFGKPVLRVKVKVSKKVNLNIFVAHLKSKRPMYLPKEDRDNPLIQAKGSARALMVRMIESVALRKILLRYLVKDKDPVVVIGDVNDTGNSVTTRIISGDAPHIKEDLKDKYQTWDTLLYHVKHIQARRSTQDVYYTHIHNGFYESLDHILVSQEFKMEYPKNVGRVQYVRTFNDHLIDNTFSHEMIPIWKSDHGQVLAEISLNSKKRKQHK